jgi:succinyl-diaminopimelate desuccinylase
VIDVDIRYLPEQNQDEILGQIADLDDAKVLSTFTRPPVAVDRNSGFVRALCGAAQPHHDGEVTGVGRDGASDAISFLRVGIPAVEFGPKGAGHHGPEEWVSVSALGAYRRALVDFAMAVPAAVGTETETAQ